MRSRFSHFHDFHCLSGPLAAHMAADADEQRDVSRAMGVVQQILATDTPEQKAPPSKLAEGPALPAPASATTAPTTGVPALYTASEGTDPAAYREPVFRGEGGVGMFDSCEIPDPNEFLAEYELDPSADPALSKFPESWNVQRVVAPPGTLGVVFQKTPGGHAIREIDSDSPLYGKLAVGDIMVGLDDLFDAAVVEQCGADEIREHFARTRAVKRVIYIRPATDAGSLISWPTFFACETSPKTQAAATAAAATTASPATAGAASPTAATDYVLWRDGALASERLAQLDADPTLDGLNWWQQHERASGIATHAPPLEFPAFLPNKLALALKRPYDQWALGELSSADLEKLQARPAHPDTGLKWWQVYEQFANIASHQPPNPLPAFARPTMLSAMQKHYESWSRGELPAADLEALHALPPDAGSGLNWWQWYEREQGLEAHRPPKTRPVFAKSEEPSPSPATATDEAAPVAEKKPKYKYSISRIFSSKRAPKATSAAPSPATPAAAAPAPTEAKPDPPPRPAPAAAAAAGPPMVWLVALQVKGTGRTHAECSRLAALIARRLGAPRTDVMMDMSPEANAAENVMMKVACGGGEQGGIRARELASEILVNRDDFELALSEVRRSPHRERARARVARRASWDARELREMPPPPA